MTLVEAQTVSPTVSLCMIVKNEAQNLARCLASVQGTVDELIIVDTGSTDQTLEIAEAARAKVFRHAWQNDFAEARNFSLQQATGDWILHLDADEALEPETRLKLKPWLSQTLADGVVMTQRSFTAGGDLVRYDDLHITRLFRNRRGYCYEQAIHEQIRPSIERRGGGVVASDFIIWHYGYAVLTAQGQTSRAKRNLELLEPALAAAPRDAYLCYQVGVTHKSLGNFARAESYLRQALDMDQHLLGDDICDNAWMKLSQLAYAAKRYGDALRYAKSSLEINPGNTVSLYISALASVAQGDIKSSQGYFARVREQPDLGTESAKEVETVLEHLKSLAGP
jgi:glycosyltransferase involved in cell wall biosynthesis